MPTERTACVKEVRLWFWAVLMLALANGHGSSDETALGRALFFGARPLAAHVAGQDWQLPQEAVVCSNCHQRGAASAPGVFERGVPAAGAAPSFGPPLTRATLTRTLARRGGPPSAYDGAKLCRAVREGIDPALVIIPQAMPRYAFTDEQCGALWAFLLTPS
jgi:hypothetical protein